ncbi:MAG: iron-sulfur cluster assembly protein [Pirellulales bacterium]|nr:iron-sulfur cluster assembly protein [Pirellulales bacterium]
MSQSKNSISEDHVLEKLKNVIDPELFVNIVDLGLIYGVVVGADEATAENKPEQKESMRRPDKRHSRRGSV